MDAKAYNAKALVSFLFGQMEALANKEISPQEACAQSKLAAQINKTVENELRATMIQMQLDINAERTTARLRDLESLGFDNAKYGEFNVNATKQLIKG